jgi:hypothetical protein
VYREDILLEAALADEHDHRDDTKTCHRCTKDAKRFFFSPRASALRLTGEQCYAIKRFGADLPTEPGPAGPRFYA